MSGIVGIFNRDGRPVDAADLEPLLRASRHRAVDGEGTWTGASAAIGHQYSRVTPESLVERQPLAAGDVIVSFDGRLDNREELIELCRRFDPAEDSPCDAALVAGAYRAVGDRCVRSLAGDFAFALFDATRVRLLLARDVMAARPLYYCARPHRVLFASEIKSLLADAEVSAEPDEDGLADLILNGYYDGHRTWFKDVWSVPPGKVVVVTADRLDIVEGWEFAATTIRYSSFPEYAEHFGAVFAEAVKRRLRSAHPVAVSVSGGLDSSSIYCEAARQARGDMVHGITLAFPSGTRADERDYVEELRSRGLHVDRVPVDELRLLVGAERVVAQAEMPRLQWDAHDTLRTVARASGCRVILDGFFGDQMLAAEAYLVDLARRGRWVLAKRHLDELASWMTDAQPGSLRRSFFGDLVRAMMPASLRRAARRSIGRARLQGRYPRWFSPAFRERALQRAMDRPESPHKFASEHARQCWRSATSGNYLATVLHNSSTGVAHQLDTAYPFRDRDLVAFVMAVPGDVVNHDGVPKALLRHATDGVLPDRIRLRRCKADFTSFSNLAAHAAEPMLRRLCGPDSLSARAGIVDPDAVRSELTMRRDALRREDSAQFGWQISDTLALELWLRRFCRN